MTLRLYLETTTFNWFFDERPGHEDVVRLFEAVKAGQFVGYTSRYVTDELDEAPEPKRSNMLNLIEDYGIISLDYSDKAEFLASKYVAAGIVPASKVYDGIHIAVASIHELDVIVSYNFHHINRNKTTSLTAVVNVREGYPPIYIYTAEEVLKHGGGNGDGSDRG